MRTGAGGTDWSAGGYILRMRTDRQPALRLVVFGVLYMCCFALATRLASADNPLAPLWPPVGVLVAGLLLLSRTPRWQLILVAFAGGRLVSPNGWPTLYTLALSCAGFLEAWIAYTVLRRLAGIAPRFTRLRDVLSLLVAIAVAETVNGVLVGVLQLATGRDVGEGFITTWIGGALGILLLVPFLIAWFGHPHDDDGATLWTPRRVTELVALVLTTIGVTSAAFRGVLLFHTVDLPPYAIALPLVWAALRFRTRELTATVLLITIIASPLQLDPTVVILGGGSFDVRLLRLQLFIGFMSTIGLVLGAALAEQRAALRAAERSAEALVESERQLRQSQKMEVVGQLTGGIAHDFNNVLSVMTLQLGEMELQQHLPSETQRSIRELEETVQRASAMARQLLRFGRRSEKVERRLDVVELCTELVRLLTRLLPRAITFALVPPERPLWVMGDPSMLEQVLMNLVLNARDAMSSGGLLTVRLLSKNLDAGATQMSELARWNLSPGPYVVLQVSDTGHGIAPEHVPQLFEPFFTTKPAGKGTGLGLSSVFTVAQQHRGYIRVLQTSPAGTVFEFGIPEMQTAPA